MEMDAKQSEPGKNRHHNSELILVVDDDKGLNRLMQKTLRKKGYQTEGALSGSEAISMIARKKYNVLLLDHALNDMSGKQVLNSLQRKKLNVPFVIVTGHGNENTAVEMMKLGAKDYIVKAPDSISTVPRAIEKAMKELDRERKLSESEKALAKSERRFMDISENALEWIWEIDLNGKYTYSSPVVERLLGYKPEEILNKCFYDFFYPNEKDKLRETLLEIFAKKQSFHEFISRSVHKNGNTVWSLSCGIPILNKKNKLTGYRGVNTNITSLKQTEQALQNALETSKLRQVEISALLAGARAVIENLDFKDAAKAIHDYCKNLIGTEEGFISLLRGEDKKSITRSPDFTDFPYGLSPDHSKTVGKLAREVYRTGRALFKNNLQKPVLPLKKHGKQAPGKNVLIAPLSIKNTVSGLLVMFNKPCAFTENDAKLASAFGELAAIALHNSRMLESLESSEEHFRSVVETASDAIVSADKEGKIVFWNNAAKSMFGYSENEALDKPLTFIMTEQCAVAYNNVLKEKGVKRKTNSALPLDIFGRKKDGREFPVELSLSCWKTGKRHFSTAILRDVTERMRSNEALRISEDQFSKAFRASPTFITISTLNDGLILNVNKSFLNASGYRREEVVGNTEEELGTWVDPDKRRKIINLLRKEGRVYNREVEFRTKSGDILTVLWSAEMIDIRGELCMLAVILDITENKKLEIQLIQAQKMEAVGQFAGGIGHDFNNILSAIINYAYLSKKNLTKDDRIIDNIEQIISLSEKGSDIIQGLLAFSRKHFTNPLPLSLNDTVKSIEKLLNKFIGEDIQINIEFSERQPVILADRAQIEQVLMNLATNARDAMPAGGSLTIETDVVKIGDEFIKTYGFGKHGTYALLSVTDTGTGMDEDTKQKIFEPFFTTKEVGKGTGLGLAIIYGIVKQHNGYIIVHSTPGQGTAVKIYFKTTKAAVKESRVKTVTDMAGYSETILIAEDEPAVRRSMKGILEDFGYLVIEASNGEEAVEAFKKNKDKINLLVFDVIMPKKSGIKAYDEIKGLAPGIRVVFTSGYAGEHIDEKMAHKKIEVVSKPVLPADFLRKIKEVLHGNQT